MTFTEAMASAMGGPNYTVRRKDWVPGWYVIGYSGTHYGSTFQICGPDGPLKGHTTMRAFMPTMEDIRGEWELTEWARSQQPK